jgi:uncharacterized membrane protein YphA (DoxX/SURF4 family)
MSSSATGNLALLILRLSVAWVFLFAAWKNTENAAAWAWTKNETALLFSNFAPEQRELLGRISAVAGMVMMYGGGGAVLTGVEPRLGGLAIAVFSLLGMRIHAIRREEAKIAAEAGNAMGWSAYGAHVAAGLKNWALIGAGLFFFLVGAGRYGLEIDLVGQILGLAGLS